MTRARRPILCLYCLSGEYRLDVLVAPLLYVPGAIRAALSASGVWLPLHLGPDPRAARRRIRSLLRAWGWPGADVRTACDWVGRDRAAFISWPWTAARGAP